MTRLTKKDSGSFAETESPEDQLHWIMENARTIRSVDGVPSLIQGLRDAARRYDNYALVAKLVS